MSSVKVLNTDTFDSHVKSGVTVIDFWAPWCGPCKMLAPVIEQISDEYGGRLQICKVNVDDNQNLAARYGIMSIPSVLVFKDGEVVDKMVGSRPKSQIKEMIDKYI